MAPSELSSTKGPSFARKLRLLIEGHRPANQRHTCGRAYPGDDRDADSVGCVRARPAFPLLPVSVYQCWSTRQNGCGVSTQRITLLVLTTGRNVAKMIHSDVDLGFRATGVTKV